MQFTMGVYTTYMHSLLNSVAVTYTTGKLIANSLQTFVFFFSFFFYFFQRALVWTTDYDIGHQLCHNWDSLTESAALHRYLNSSKEEERCHKITDNCGIQPVVYPF